MNMSDVSEGRVLLELTHRCAGEGEKVSWVPTGTQYTGIQCIAYCHILYYMLDVSTT